MTRRSLERALIGIITAMLSLVGTLAFAGDREQAYEMFNRLNGVPPSPKVWDAMTALIAQKDLRGAALAAINDDRGNFYNVVVRNWAMPWTNENDYVREDLNDMVATIIGMTRDEIPFDRALYDDIVYVGISPDPENELPDYSVRQTFENTNIDGNLHYRRIDERNLPAHKVLIRKKQSDLSYLSSDVTAGIFTSRQYGLAFFNAGTNRAAMRFAYKNLLCHDIDSLLDTSRPDLRVRQDVSRQPGGDASVYKNRCSGCHAGMDGMAGSTAYYDWDNTGRGLVYNPATVHEKHLRNANEFAGGYVTKDDSWINLWAEGGPNQALGWNGARKGKGLKSWGKMMSQSDAFSQCMAQKALVSICDVNPEDSSIKTVITQLANSFKTKGRFNLKYLFAQSAILCRGD